MEKAGHILRIYKTNMIKADTRRGGKENDEKIRPKDAGLPESILNLPSSGSHQEYAPSRRMTGNKEPSPGISLPDDFIKPQKKPKDDKDPKRPTAPPSDEQVVTSQVLSLIKELHRDVTGISDQMKGTGQAMKEGEDVTVDRDEGHGRPSHVEEAPSRAVDYAERKRLEKFWDYLKQIRSKRIPDLDSPKNSDRPKATKKPDVNPNILNRELPPLPDSLEVLKTDLEFPDTLTAVKEPPKEDGWKDMLKTTNFSEDEYRRGLVFSYRDTVLISLVNFWKNKPGDTIGLVRVESINEVKSNDSEFDETTEYKKLYDKVDPKKIDSLVDTINDPEGIKLWRLAKQRG